MSDASTALPRPVALADLGDNLIIRSARREDAAAVADLVYRAHEAKGSANDSVRAWVLDLMQRPHPTLTVENVLVVENTLDGSIVSTLNLIPQTWSYGGVPFGVSRVELVGTDPAYEGRGLVRRQFEVLHRWSTERGHLLQAITGIPNFYLQFGYEFALDTGGGRSVDRAEVPALSSHARELTRIRVAEERDFPALVRIDRRAGERSLVACERDAASWRYELSGRSPTSMLSSTILILETNPVSDARPDIIGYAVLGSGGFPGGSPAESVGLIRRFEIAAGFSWERATYALLRHLTSESGGIPPTTEIQFVAGEHHPAYVAAPRALARSIRSWSWYIRIPNLAAFLAQISPVLEARLAASDLAGYSGALTVSFYRTALRLRFDGGRVIAESWPDPNFRTAEACFPGLSFLQLVLGYRNPGELEFASPDCRAGAGIPRQLIETLFPKADSSVWPIG